MQVAAAATLIVAHLKETRGLRVSSGVGQRHIDSVQSRNKLKSLSQDF